MRFAWIFCLFLAFPAFSQKKVKVKNNIKLEFPVFKDTLFRGYPNVVTVKGIDDLGKYNFEAEGCSVKLTEGTTNSLTIIAQKPAKQTELIIRQASDNKEIYRHTLTIAVFKKEYTDRIKRNGK
ncbi:MAG: hypothetical protein K0R65_1563 [Crocinitomicaceae bacterium]|jgi:hypothetical protein|nr:hypothetical protein [Crocinitomicaceae bacterium]